MSQSTHHPEDVLIIAKQNEEILKLNDTVEMLLLKIKKMEQLIKLKDHKIAHLTNSEVEQESGMGNTTSVVDDE